MPTYGRQVLATTGNPIEVAAEGTPIRPAAGITLDWSTVTAAAAATTLADGTPIAVGEKYIEFGTILPRIILAEVQTVTISGTPTGGTFTVTGNGNTSSPIAYNANAATVQAAIRALGGQYAGVVVTGTGPYTVTFPNDVSDPVVLTASGAGLTGGSSPSVAVATTTPGSASAGKYGPYDAGASDGRQTVTRNACYILNTTIKERDAGGLVATASDHPDVIAGGLVWKSRIKMGGTGQPSVSTVEAAFPQLRYAEGS